MQNTAPTDATNDLSVVIPIKRKLHWLLSLRVLVLSLLLGVGLILQASADQTIIPPFTYISYFIAGVYLFTIASAVLLRRIQKYTLFAHIQIITDTALISALVYFSGGSQSIFITLYFFPIIAGGLMLSRKGGLAMAALCTINYGLILFFEYINYYPLITESLSQSISDPLVAANFFSVHGITFFLVSVLSVLLSERIRRTEKALSQASKDYDQLSLLYKQIFDDITTGIITIDGNNNITSFNPASEKITGFAAAELLGRTLHTKLPDIELVKKGNFRPFTELTRKNGGKIPVGYSWAALHTDSESENYQIITLQDLSEIKRMEDQVKQAEKMAALGEMAAGIAHEFRNPLAAISGSAQMLNKELETNPLYANLMTIIVRECGRLETTIADFLQFSKPAVPEKEWLPVTNLINDAVELLRQTPACRECHEITVKIPHKMDCWGDAQQLVRVLVNLIHNGCNALGEDGGEIHISAHESSENEGGEATVVTISDNGPGIPPEIREKIFVPFFTTREKGTGLGLAIVHQIIDNHGGHISVTCDQENGTSFEISLPTP